MQRAQAVLARNLRALIKRRGYRTVELFAHENGIDKGWLSRVLAKKVDPSFTRIVKLSKALEVDLNSLYPGKRR